jgi:site-specific recombinase XerD
LDIGEQAKSFMGEMGELEERVFVGLKYSAYMNVELSKWVMRAGITKDITYHCSRHTFAVLQLNLGTDIFTVSKLLGHTHLKTTQVYAKIVDEKKKEAMNVIPNIKI